MQVYHVGYTYEWIVGIVWCIQTQVGYEYSTVYVHQWGISVVYYDNEAACWSYMVHTCTRGIGVAVCTQA